MLATEILTEDHDQAITLIDEIKDRHNNERGNRDMFRELDLALRTRMRVEEEIFYPALEADPEFNGLMAESVQEHDKCRRMLDQMENLQITNSEFHKLLLDLRFAVKNHADKEEADVFPRAIAVLGPDRLDELGTEIDAARGTAGMIRSANI
jgi:hemerythrin-like domain-containing protein